MAWTIWEGAARNNWLAIRTRLTNSHSSSPPTTESVPAKYFSRTVVHMSVGNLCDAGKEQPFGGKTCRQIAERLQRLDELAELCHGDLSRRFEIPAADQEVIGAIDLFLFQAADLHQDADGLVTVGWRVEPSHAPVVDEAELFDRAFVGAGPIGVHRHAGERHIDVIHGIAEIVEPCRLGVEIERRRQDRGIDRAGLQSRK